MGCKGGIHCAVTVTGVGSDHPSPSDVTPQIFVQIKLWVASHEYWAVQHRGSARRLVEWMAKQSVVALKTLILLQVFWRDIPEE